MAMEPSVLPGVTTFVLLGGLCAWCSPALSPPLKPTGRATGRAELKYWVCLCSESDLPQRNRTGLATPLSSNSSLGHNNRLFLQHVQYIKQLFFQQGLCSCSMYQKLSQRKRKLGRCPQMKGAFILCGTFQLVFKGTCVCRKVLSSFDTLQTDSCIWNLLVKGERGCGLDQQGICSSLSLYVCNLETFVNLTVKVRRACRKHYQHVAIQEK